MMRKTTEAKADRKKKMACQPQRSARRPPARGPMQGPSIAPRE